MEAPLNTGRPGGLSVLIPSSLTAESRDLRAKTLRVGWVARACAAFRVGEVVVYRDAPDEGRLLTALLRYIETPQYLRKHLFPRRPELGAVGVLPPLRTPHHPLEREVRNLRPGEVREGFVLRGGVEIGVERLARPRGPMAPGKRATVRVLSTEPLAVAPAEPPPGSYWGYRVRTAPGLVAALEGWRGTRLLTSRRGQPYNEARPNLGAMANLAVVFGAPTRGLPEMLADAGRRAEEFGPVVNTLPGQGVATLRVEEALWTTLALLNLERHGGRGAEPSSPPP